MSTRVDCTFDRDKPHRGPNGGFRNGFDIGRIMCVGFQKRADVLRLNQPRTSWPWARSFQGQKWALLQASITIRQGERVAKRFKPCPRFIGILNTSRPSDPCRALETPVLPNKPYGGDGLH
jgi:hypothetical protein